MKRSSVLVCVFALALLAAASCGGTKSIPALFTAMKSTTPVFSTGQSKSSLTSSTGFTKSALMNWGPSAPLYDAFQLLQDYSPDGSGPKVDMGNLYMNLYESGQYLDKAQSSLSLHQCTSRAAGSITSPFDFGADYFPDTYDCGDDGKADEPAYGSSYAYKEDANKKQYLLASYKWAPESTQTTYGVIQVEYDAASGDVRLNLAQRVQYSPDSPMAAMGGGFGLRTQVIGNSKTHAFTLRTGTHLVGKGVSQGAGNYFLMKSGGKYFCIPASATESDLQAMNQDGSDTVDANCAAYQADVDALVPFASVPASLDEFHGVDGIYMF